MPDFNPTVFDLALYFSTDQGDISPCWVPQSVYTAVPCKLDPVWTHADLFEPELEGGASFYVANLARLQPPGQSPLSASAKPAALPHANSAEPGPKDLVIIPYGTPNSAFVVKRAVYTDPKHCPKIEENPKSIDIDIMALNQGVVLANMPKASAPAGWTCYLLSLISLKSGAVPGADVTDKAAYHAHVSSKLKR